MSLRNNLQTYGALLALFLFGIPVVAFALFHGLYLIAAGGAAPSLGLAYVFYKGLKREQELPEPELNEKQVLWRRKLYPVASALALLSFAAGVYFSIFRLTQLAFLLTIIALFWSDPVIKATPDRRTTILDWNLAILFLLIPLYMVLKQFGIL